MYRHEKAQPSTSTADLITLAPKVLKKTTMKDEVYKSTFLWSTTYDRGLKQLEIFKFMLFRN